MCRDVIKEEENVKAAVDIQENIRSKRTLIYSFDCGVLKQLFNIVFDTVKLWCPSPDSHC